MRVPVCAVSSDWHLEKNAWAKYPELSGDAYYSLAQIVDTCVAQHIPLVAPGDLFDKPYPDARSVWEAMRQMDRMQDESLPVLYIQGQHERSREQPWLGLHGWPIYLHQNTVSLGNLSFCGLDYTRPDELATKLDQVCCGHDILVCHQVWQDFNLYGQDGYLSMIPCVKAVFTGDYHRHDRIVVAGRDTQQMLVLSPGSICMQAIDEPPDKSFFILYDDLSVESVQLKTRPFHGFDLTEPELIEEFLGSVNSGFLEPDTSLPEEISKPIVSVKYCDAVDAYRRIVEAVGSRAHLFMRPIHKASAVQQSNQEQDQTNKEVINLGLEGNLHKLCKQDGMTYKTVLRLLQSSDPVKELASVENEYLSSVGVN